MVDRKKAPFVPDEQQQEALKRIQGYARNWAIATYAQEEFISQNPSIVKNEVYASVNAQYKNPSSAYAEAQKHGIPLDLASKTYNETLLTTNEALKKGEYRENLNEIKAGWSEKIHLKALKSDPGIIAEQKEEKAIREARVLSDEEKQALVDRLRIYFTEAEIKKSAVESFKEKNPAKYKENIVKLNEFITMGTTHPFTANHIDYPIQAKNGLLKIPDQLIGEIQEEIKAGKHNERIENWKNILNANPSPVFQTETSKSPKEDAAIQQIQDYARNYALRNAAVAGVMKENPSLAEANSNKIMEYMAIPNPLDAPDPRNPRANEFKKAFNEATIKINEEIDKGKHSDTIEKMKKDLSDSFTPPLKKSKIGDTDLPDHVKKSALKVTYNLRDENIKLNAESAGTPDGNKIYLSATPPKQSQSYTV